MKNTTARLLELPKIQDSRGNLTFLQYPDQLPFPIARVFYAYDIPGGEIRGGHAYRNQQELIIALSGSFDVIVNDGCEEKKILLNRSYLGLFVPPLTWRHMENFSTNALSLHIVDCAFDAKDYIRDINEFEKLVQ